MAAVAGGICMGRTLAWKQVENGSGDHLLLSHQTPDKTLFPTLGGQREQQAEETVEVFSKGPSQNSNPRHKQMKDHLPAYYMQATQHKYTK